MTEAPPATVHCSFCNASNHQAEMLIGGLNNVFICTACVDQSVGVIARYRRDGVPPLPPPEVYANA